MWNPVARFSEMIIPKPGCWISCLQLIINEHKKNDIQSTLFEWCKGSPEAVGFVI